VVPAAPCPCTPYREGVHCAVGRLGVYQLHHKVHHPRKAAPDAALVRLATRMHQLHHKCTARGCTEGAPGVHHAEEAARLLGQKS
jgi:hypothetical protein